MIVAPAVKKITFKNHPKDILCNETTFTDLSPPSIEYC